MKIKSLEMIGFKSFVDRIQLSFPEGITAIVGPNGCGKSNLVDSILWAIGERSARHLRGRLMEDIIFSGAEGRKPLGMAEVTLTFSNEDGHVPQAYAHYPEITITRRVYRSGESEFFINRVPCRLRDITDLFLDSGMAVDGYSIVEQGRVEYLIKANPEERRFLIEEAAGIAKYKERKRLALMKMEATEQNLVRIQDIIAEVKRQIVFLERQAKRAEQYRSIRKEMKEIELRFALEEYQELSEKGEAIGGYLQALRERETLLSAQIAERDASIEAMKLQDTEEEERLRSLEQEFFERARQIQRLESELEFFRREAETLGHQESRLLEEVRETLRSRRQILRDRREGIERLKALAEEYARSEEGLESLETSYGKAKAQYQSLLERSEEEKGKLIDTLTELAALKNRLMHLEERGQDLEKRRRMSEEEREKTEKGLGELEGMLSEMAKDKQLLLSIRSALQEESRQIEREIESLKGIHLKTQRERQEKEEELRGDRSRYLSLRELQDNFEGYEKGVRSILLQKKEAEERWNGILGTVADIFDPEPGYELPLEAVLGQRLQSLIVKDRAQALAAISFLKRESLGRGSFVPRAIPERRNGGQRLSEISAEGDPPPLIRFVKVKEGYEGLAEFLLGDVAVVETSGQAREGELRTFVTLEGDVFEPTGVVSGGSRDQGLTLLERRREIRQLERKLREKEEEVRALLEEEKRQAGELGEKELELQRRSKEIQERELALIHRERDLEHLGRDLSRFHQKMDVLAFEQKQLEEEADVLLREEQRISAEIEAQEKVRVERADEVHALKRSLEALGEEADRLGREITEKKVLLVSLEEKRKAMESRVLDLGETGAALKEQILRKLDEIREAREKRVSLEERIDLGQKEIEGALRDYHDREVALSTEREKVEAQMASLKEAEASSRYLRQELEGIRQRIHEEEMRLSEVRLKLEHLQESMRERHGTSLAGALSAVSGEFPREEMAQRLAELKAALEGFGEVNLMAVEEYQELKKRHDFLAEQQADLAQALEALRKAIARINRTTTKRFEETFQRVNEKFKEVFIRLFGGGQASLVMLDEQDPSTSGVDIIAQPPGKKLQNIDLLSGGEKALVAIALIFGILMIKPTPFCLLDEVDAPLDDANISRFIDLVREFSKNSQFILITHNKKTMETANTLYGITMETPGVSKAVSVRLN